MTYRRSGRSGLQLPALTLGLWRNFGHDVSFEASPAIVRRAFDLGITHFDLANNYGPPYGSAEENFGRLLREDLTPYRDEIVVSTKAGYHMWDARTASGNRANTSSQASIRALRGWGSTTSTSSTRIASTRTRRKSPLEETMGALDIVVRQGKALYVGISSYSAEKTREAAAILHALGTPLVIHQPSYSMLNRWIEPDLLDALGDLGVGCIGFSPLAQGMLTDRYLDGSGRVARESAGLALAGAADRRDARQDPRAERDREGTGSVARADGARLDAA